MGIRNTDVKILIDSGCVNIWIYDTMKYAFTVKRMRENQFSAGCENFLTTHKRTIHRTFSFAKYKSQCSALNIQLIQNSNKEIIQYT